MRKPSTEISTIGPGSMSSVYSTVLLGGTYVCRPILVDLLHSPPGILDRWLPLSRCEGFAQLQLRGVHHLRFCGASRGAFHRDSAHEDSWRTRERKLNSAVCGAFALGPEVGVAP